MDEAAGRKRGGREGRRTRRSEVNGQAPAFITRAIPFYEILGEEGLDRIETHAETILQEIGGSHTVFAPAYGSPFVRDREGGRRYASIEDFRNFVKLADNDSFEQWRDAGEHDAEARAHQRWKQVLATVEPPPLDQGIDEALREFIARKKAAVPDSWYWAQESQPVTVGCDRIEGEEEIASVLDHH